MHQAGEFRYFIRKHRQGMQYHFTSWFLPMHRALLHEFEQRLLSYIPQGELQGLPYWDESLDSAQPLRSPLFSNEGVGPATRGRLQGPFAGFRDDQNGWVVREPENTQGQFSWIPQNQVMAESLRRFRGFGELSRVIEVSPHAQYHTMIGGSMGDVGRSPSDPIFWLHHAYIDLLWAVWQGLRSQNLLNLSTLNTQATVQLSDPVPLYESEWTVANIADYRTQMCYRYESVTNEKVTVSFRQFTPLQPINATRLLEWMPGANLTEVRATEKYFNRLIQEMNTKIRKSQIRSGPGLMTIQDMVVLSNQGHEKINGTNLNRPRRPFPWP